MKKRIAIAVIIIFCVLTLIAVFRPRQDQVSSIADFINEAEQMGNRLEEALGDEWSKTREVKIIPIEFEDTETSDKLTYYICQTTYFDEIPEITGLDPVLNEIIDPAAAEESRQCSVNDLDAMLYQKDGRAYLCWTVSPEYSLAIEYNPESVEEWEIFKMAESAPAKVEE